jgi:vitamin B12 transporter
MRIFLYIILILTINLYMVKGQSADVFIALDTIYVLQKKTPELLKNTSQSILVIDQEQIKNSASYSLAELLQNTAGIDIKRRGIHGIQSDVSIRGSTFDQVLILLNGMPLSDPQTGHHALNIPVDLQDVDRIEILKGPAARKYGQNAFAGAINIITKVEKKSNVLISGDFSSFNTGRLHVRASVPSNKMNQQLSFSKSFSEGYRYNTDYVMDQFNYQNSSNFNKNTLFIQLGHSQRSFGANGFYASPSNKDQFEQIGTSTLLLNYEIKKNNVSLKPSVYIRRNQDEYIFIRNNPSIYRNLHIGKTYGSELNTTIQHSIGIFSIGIEARIDDFQSNNLGDQKRKTIGVHIEEKFILLNKKLDISPGIAGYNYSDFGTQFFPGVDVGFQVMQDLKVFFNSGYTWRIPTYTDLFYSDPVNEGNSELKPEKAWTNEIGLRLTKSFISLQGAAFSRSSKDLIDWSKLDSIDKWRPSNIASVNTQGIETQIILDFTKIKMSYPTLTIGYTFLETTFQTDKISRYSLDFLKHQATAQLTIPIVNKLKLNINGRFLDRINMADYWLLDSRIQYSFNSFDISLFANNAFDKAYTETNLVPMPGRWLGVSLQLKL